MEDAKKVVLVDDTSTSAALEAAATEQKNKLEIKPRRSCKHCHGRGYTGSFVDKATGERKKMLCRCVGNQYQKINAKLRVQDAVQAAANAEERKLDSKLGPAEVTAKSGWEEAPKAEALAPA